MDMPPSWLAQPCPNARLGHAVVSAQLGLWMHAACFTRSIYGQRVVLSTYLAQCEQKFVRYSPRSPPQFPL